MRTKRELDQAAEGMDIQISELENVRRQFKSQRSMVALLQQMDCRYKGDWHRIRILLMFAFDFAPKHFSMITAWRRKEDVCFDDVWLENELSEKMESARYLYE